jgi:hypothetical protein
MKISEKHQSFAKFWSAEDATPRNKNNHQKPREIRVKIGRIKVQNNKTEIRIFRNEFEFEFLIRSSNFRTSFNNPYCVTELENDASNLALLRPAIFWDRLTADDLTG